MQNIKSNLKIVSNEHCDQQFTDNFTDRRTLKYGVMWSMHKRLYLSSHEHKFPYPLGEREVEHAVGRVSDNEHFQVHVSSKTHTVPHFFHHHLPTGSSRP